MARRSSCAMAGALIAILGLLAACSGSATTGGGGTSSVAGPLQHWQTAVTGRDESPARIAVISDSMAEMTSDGWASVWPHVLGGDGWRYVPAVASWGIGAHTMTGGDIAHPPANIIGAQATDAEWVAMPQAVLRNDRQSVTWDVSAASKVMIFYTVMAGRYVPPRYALDDADPVTVDGAVSNDNNYRSTEIDVSKASTLTVTKGRDGDASANGVLARFGDSSISVMNLSRSGSKVAQWSDWLAASGPTEVMTKLLIGFEPDLVVLPSGGNDFQDDLNWLGWEARLDALLAHVRSLSPQASVAINTNPPADAPGWAEFNQWTREWAAANNVALVDWESLPKAGKPNRWYQSDGLHPRSLLSERIAGLAGEALLPDGLKP